MKEIKNMEEIQTLLVQAFVAASRKQSISLLVHVSAQTRTPLRALPRSSSMTNHAVANVKRMTLALDLRDPIQGTHVHVSVQTKRCVT